jgi:hypothetical protein
MGKIEKTFALMIVIVIAVSSLTLLIVKPVSAQSQSIPIPSVPQFTVQVFEMVSLPLSSNKMPLVNVTIVNQPFIPYTDRNGNKINLYYLMEWKRPTDLSWQQGETPLQQSNANYTFYSFGLIADLQSANQSPPGQVEFQVEAVIGTYIQGGYAQGEYSPPTYIGENSGWSKTQTITLTAPLDSPTASTPSYAPVSLTVYVSLAFVAVLLAIIVFVLKRKTASNTT